MGRYLQYGAMITLLVLAVGSVPAMGLPATGDDPATNPTRDMANTEHDKTATVEIDCNASQVQVTAPDDYEYGLTVTVVNVTQSGTSTSTSSQSPYWGNVTVEYSGTGANGIGVVYAFVTDESTEEPAVTESAQCGKLPGANATNVTNTTDDLSIAIDCNESVVRFTAPDDVSYTARVSSVDVSPTGSSSSSVSQTAAGNTTVSVDDGLVVAFASTASADEPVSAVRDCSRTDSDDEPAPAEESCTRD